MEWCRVDEVRYSQVQAWVTQLAERRGATSVLRAHGVLAGILDVAVKDRRLSINPARGMNLPRKTKKERAYLTVEEVELLAVNAGAHGAMALFLAYTGLRWGEATGLRLAHLDMLRRRVRVTENAVKVG
jgi:integrase